MPIYCLSRDGSLVPPSIAAQNRPGYGIAQKVDQIICLMKMIWLIDRNLNSSTLIKSINELVEDLNLSKEKEYLNHLSFSPDAK